MTTGWKCTINGEFSPSSHNGLYLVLLNVNIYPAHLLLLYNDCYFSLSTKNVEVSKPFEPLFKVILSKKIPSLFLMLKSTTENIEIETLLTNIFASYSPLNESGITCLDPVKSVLSELYKFNSSASLVFDLLNEIQQVSGIQKVFARNVPPGEFHLYPYTVEDVKERIHFLLGLD